MTLPTAHFEEMRSLPALISRAAQTLSSATTAAEVLEAREAANLAYDAAKRAARFAAAKGAHDELLAKVHRAQADALTIEAEAKRRLADEYDAAQERKEIGGHGGDRTKFPDGKLAKATEVIPPKDLHEARLIRDAEKAEPGIVRRAVDEALEAGEEPTKARVRRAVLRVARDEPAPTKPLRGKAAISARVVDALTTLSGLPPASEVVGYLRGTDAAVIVDERLQSVHLWLEEFASIWGDDNAD